MTIQDSVLNLETLILNDEHIYRKFKKLPQIKNN